MDPAKQLLIKYIEQCFKWGLQGLPQKPLQ